MTVDRVTRASRSRPSHAINGLIRRRSNRVRDMYELTTLFTHRHPCQRWRFSQGMNDDDDDDDDDERTQDEESAVLSAATPGTT